MNLTANLFNHLHWLTLLDIALVYIIVYYSLVWVKDTHSFNLIRGFFLVLSIYVVSHVLRLTTLNWLLGHFANALILIVIILLQPELRRVLALIGRGQLFTPFLATTEGQETAIIKQILRAVETLSKQKIGGLIVIEQSSNLNEYVESGIKTDASISAELMTSLFWPNTPTHDGAIFLRDNKIAAVECMLPLTDAKIRDRRLGTRHRAALGLSEKSDALIIVVSEETGVISLAENGNLTRFLTREALEARLFNLYKETPTNPNPFSFRQFFQGLSKKKTP